MNATAQEYQPAEIYTGMRNMILTTDPKSVGPLPPSGIAGLLMESGHPGAVITLVAMEEGAVSIYFSTGGGVIGLGPHEGPTRARQKLLALAPEYLNQTKETAEYPLPKQDFTRFYFITSDGVRMSEEIRTDDLGYMRHALAPLFHQAHELLYEARLVDEKQNAGQKP